MKASNKTRTPEINLNNKLDTFRRGFAGGYFYGLEYILEEFFQNTTGRPEKPPVPSNPDIDWFGLYE